MKKSRASTGPARTGMVVCMHIVRHAKRAANDAKTPVLASDCVCREAEAEVQDYGML